MTDSSVDTAELILDSGKVNVNVSFEPKYINQRDTSKVSESENILYIKISDWAFGFDYETEAMTKARAKLDEIKEASKNARKRNITLISSETFYAGGRYMKLYSGINSPYDPDMYPPEYKGTDEKACKEFPSYNGEKKFKGKLIILTDSNSASASEEFVTMARLIDKDNVIQVGENTSGCISYGGVKMYYLPESGIIINLAASDLSEEALFAKNEKWAGETYGFMPDYWVTNALLPETLEALTGSKTVMDLF